MGIQSSWSQKEERLTEWLRVRLTDLPFLGFRSLFCAPRSNSLSLSLCLWIPNGQWSPKTLAGTDSDDYAGCQSPPPSRRHSAQPRTQSIPQLSSLSAALIRSRSTILRGFNAEWRRPCGDIFYAGILLISGSCYCLYWCSRWCSGWYCGNTWLWSRHGGVVRALTSCSRVLISGGRLFYAEHCVSLKRQQHAGIAVSWTIEWDF